MTSSQHAVSPQRSLGTTITLCVGVMLILMAVVGIVGWRSIRILGEELQTLSRNNLQAAVQLANTQNALWELRYTTPQFILGDAAARAQLVADQSKWYQQIKENLAAYEHGTRTEEERRALTEWQEVYVPYVRDRPRFFELEAAGRIKESRAWRAERMTPRGRMLVQILDHMINLQRQAAAAAEQEAVDQVSIVTSILLGTMGLTLAIGVGIAFWLTRRITRPVAALTEAAQAITAGDLSQAVRVSSRDEVGVLAAAFNHMMSTLNQQRTELVSQQAALVTRNEDLERAMRDVRTATTEREALSYTLRQMSVPVVPILEGVLVLPLVGELDQERTRLLSQRLLEGVAAQRADIAILDITGVPFVDATVVEGLLKATAAATLIGTRCILVGIRPEVAEAMVASGFEIKQLSIHADLRGAVEDALRTRSKTRSSKGNVHGDSVKQGLVQNPWSTRERDR